MKFLFLVQGEGRGHISQAISLYGLLTREGHEVTAALIGKSPRREIPGYFYARLPVYTASYRSPNFKASKNRKGVDLAATFLYNLLNVPAYLFSVVKIRRIVKAKDPDVIVNFYDMLGGVYNFFFRDKKTVCIGHHFFYSHPSAFFPEGRKTERALLLWLNKIVSYGASRILALSFREVAGAKRITIVPPLLRKEFEGEPPPARHDKPVLLGYLLNDGFAHEAIEWSRRHREIECHFFWDNPRADREMKAGGNLTFHKIDDRLFIEYMKSSDLFASTAGFESLCEAMYLGKPFLCAPSENHYEQACNAIDATRDGAGIYDRRFNLDRLLEFQKTYSFDNAAFRKWARQAGRLFIRHLTDW